MRKELEALKATIEFKMKTIAYEKIVKPAYLRLNAAYEALDSANFENATSIYKELSFAHEDYVVAVRFHDLISEMAEATKEWKAYAAVNPLLQSIEEITKEQDD